MQGLRKSARTAAIIALAMAGLLLLADGFGAGAPALQFLLGAGALLGALGLVATWFFPTS